MPIDKIFIVGNSRSGTKLLGTCLNLHSQVKTFRELHFFDEIVLNPYKKINRKTAEKILNRLGLNPNLNLKLPNCLNDKDEQIPAHELYDHILSQVLKLKNKRIACDPTPRNLFYAKNLIEIYPNSLFVVLVRDIRAILLSQKYRWRAVKEWKRKKSFEAFRSFINYNTFITTFIWKKNFKESEKLAREIKDSTLIIKYEDLIQSPKNELDKITKRCNIDFETSMLDVKVINTSDINKKGIQGFDKSRINAWESDLGKTEIWIAQKLCQKEMLQLGYPLLGVKPNILVLTAKVLTLPLHLCLIFLVNMIKSLNLIYFTKKILAS
ncbi:MAG: protein-tyrosine sulfotransferase [Tenuifilum sp.]|jgi:hypothetical protein|uniref:sulfotransferase family protein n=1 Tax=Tenuifilum sp. TaxID=2760880 RepID=UPI0024AB47CB|nr:sulfotransferase [Tenuifilum sp.]MDI3527072.1 protein-tyrosine sulfotransferase [Tenuifilum sp.]